MERNGLPFVAKCAAVLPALWLALFLLALPFPGGHPSLPALVAVVPASLSLTGRAAGWLMGEPGNSSVSLTVARSGDACRAGLRGCRGRRGSSTSVRWSCPRPVCLARVFPHLRRVSHIRECARHLQSCHQCRAVCWFDQLEARGAPKNCEGWRPKLSRYSAFGARERIRA